MRQADTDIVRVFCRRAVSVSAKSSDVDVGRS